MSLRTRLIIAFLLLSVVPLSAVTFFTYRSWVDTFERAVQREASQSATDISRRMERITAEVGRRMDRLFVPDPVAGSSGTGDMRERVAPMLGDAAPLVERVEFHPAEPPTPPAPPSPEAPPSGPAAEPSPRALAQARPAPAPPAPPPPPPDGRAERGGRGWGGRGDRPAASRDRNPTEVVVVDVQQALKEAGKAAAAGIASATSAAPAELAPLLDKALSGLAPSVESIMTQVGAVTAEMQAKAEALKMEVDGQRVQIAVMREGRMVGRANAMLNLERTLQTAFMFARRDQGEIPFALDTRGVLHNPNPRERQLLESIGAATLAQAATDGRARRAGDWLVVARRDPSGLTFGIARPIGESLREIRRAAMRNLSIGLAVIGLALVGIVPISHGMTKRLATLTSGVRQLANGDFRARVPVRSSDEVGTLAAAFNQMAEDLEKHQALVVEQERLRRELELSRLIQTEMLPRSPLRLGTAEINGISIPAREVGGDFFNYFELPDGRLALLVGDVSGKGVSAALLMANVQATLRARLPLESDLAKLAAALDVEVDRTTPGAVYVTLFIGILDTARHELRYVNAGHNPQFVVHAGGGVDAMPATGMPIALYAGHPYREAVAPVCAGDLIFFYTDGLPETENDAGEMFGIERLQALLAEEQPNAVDTVLQRVEAAVRDFRGRSEALDDATLMALRVTG